MTAQIQMNAGGAGYYELNRPVHLARRDSGVERAVELLAQPTGHLPTAARIEHVERVIALLRTASHHARLAARSPRAGDSERDFLHFLALTLQQVESVQALIHHQAHLESKEHGFLSKFLGVNPDEVTLSAINFQRRAEDMLEGLWQVLRMSSTPYRRLQQDNLKDLTAEERERYQRAMGSFRTAVSKYAPPLSAPQPAASARNAGPPPVSGATEFPI